MLNRLRITFLLPGACPVPVGGTKIVYEYANRLASRGHTVAIVHAASKYVDATLGRKLYHTAGYLYRRVTLRYRPTSWISIQSNVKLIWAPSLAEKYVPDGDIVIATAWQTAEWAARYVGSKGKGFYLVQHLETWEGMEERVYATWKLPLHKIVIARWLQQIASDLGQEATYIPNGLDLDVFRVVNPIAERSATNVAMLYHHYAWKGSKDGIRALSIVRESVPDLRVTLFGVPQRPSDLPDWFKYRHCASQSLLREIYNHAGIFVAPSLTEGWGLPACEAMMCGAALVATDVGGHREFAIHGETALLSPPGDEIRLSQNILRLMRDPTLRLQIAQRGNEFVQQFTWKRAVDALESLLLISSSIGGVGLAQ